jgi:protein-tyrosine phosphatase
MPIRICFVCLGNICRSPTAEATMRRLVEEAGLSGEVELDSAGTGGWHVGEPPDERAQVAGKRRGLELRGRARKVSVDDFEHFDYLVAMDGANREDLYALSPDDDARDRIELLRNFDPDSPPDAEVPDPYYGEGDGFERVLDICEAGCRGLLGHIRDRHSL